MRRVLIVVGVSVAACTFGVTASSSGKLWAPPGYRAWSNGRDISACEGRAATACYNAAFDFQRANPPRAVEMWAASCWLGRADGCGNAGTALSNADGVPLDGARAVELGRYGCEALGGALACTNLGANYSNGVGVARDQRAALDLFLRGCAANLPIACTSAAVLLGDTQGGVVDLPRAKELYAKACELKQAPACLQLVTRFGEGLMPNEREGLLQRACAEGGKDTVGCLELGALMLSQGKRGPAMGAFAIGCERKSGEACWQLGGLESDPGRKWAAYERACSAGYLLGCNGLGYLAMKRGDYALALQYFEPTCARGENYACRNLGVLYLYGNGVAADGAKAQQYLTKACDGGVGSGCKVLGVQHSFGMLVPKNAEKARAAYERACDLGACEGLVIARMAGELGPKDPIGARAAAEKGCAHDKSDAASCARLAEFRYSGLGGPVDHAGAAQAASKGCLADNQWACNTLAYELANGRGINLDVARALSLWTSACTTLPEACDSRGEAYEKGFGGLKKDLARALADYQFACEKGISVSCTNAARVARALKKPVPVALPAPKKVAEDTKSASGLPLTMPDFRSIVSGF